MPKSEDIFAALDDLRAKRRALVDAEIAVEKLKLTHLFEMQDASSQANQPSADGKLKTLKEIAAHIGVCTKTIRRWIDERDFPSRLAGDDYRFSVTDVDRWTLEDHKKRSNNNGHK